MADATTLLMRRGRCNHFIDEAWQTQCCALETIDFHGSHNAFNIAEKLIACTERFQVPAHKIKAVQQNQAANVELAREIILKDFDWDTIMCGVHHLQNCIKTALEESGKRHDNFLSACQEVVSHFNRSALASNALEEQQHIQGSKKNPEGCSRCRDAMEQSVLYGCSRPPIEGAHHESLFSAAIRRIVH